MGLFILVVSRGAWSQWSRAAVAVVQAEARGALGQGGDLGPPGSQARLLPGSFPLCAFQSSTFPVAGGVLVLQPF